MPALTTPQIVGRIALPDDANPTNAVIRFTMTGFDTDDGADVVVVNVPVDAPIDAGGDIDVDLWPNPSGIRATLYAVQYVQRRADARDIEINLGRIEVPAGAGPYNLNDLLPIDPNSPANPSIQQMIDELRARDDQEEAARISADNSLSSRINTEQSARIAGDNALGVRIDGLSSGIFYAGTFDPAGGSFPASSLRGGTYRATSSGTVGGQAFDIGDRITAKVDGASTSVFAGNWDRASTSAEVADLDAKFSDTLRFYGAVGDGVTNDTAAVTAADVAAGPYIDMEGLTYITTINASALTKKYYNGTMYVQNSSGNQSVLANETPYQEAEIRQLGTKSRFFDWDGADILWLGTSIPQFGGGLDGYPELSADALNATVLNRAWSGSHATFKDLADINDTDINEVKALSMTDADVAAGFALYGPGSVFDPAFDVVTKAFDMTMEQRIFRNFENTDFDVVVLDHNHNDRRNEWGTLAPEATTITAITKAEEAVVTVSGIGTISVGDFVAMRQTGIAGLDYACGRVQAVAGSSVTIAYDTTGMVGSFASGTLYKLDRSTVFGGFEACIYAIKNSSLRYGSGNVHIILCGAPSEFTGDNPDNNIRSIAVAIRQISAKWDLPFFDVATAMSVNEQDHIVYFPDTVHPSTPETRAILSRYWVEWLRGGRDLALNKSDFVAASPSSPAFDAPYTFDRFTGAASASGSVYGGIGSELVEDFSGDLSAYTLVGTSPVIIAAPWGDGSEVLYTFTSGAQANSYIQRSLALTTSAGFEFDFQFDEIASDTATARKITLAELRGGGVGLNYSVDLFIGADESAKLRLAYFDSETKLKTSALPELSLTHDTKYNVKFEVVPDVGDGFGRALLYVDGVVVARTVMDNGSVPVTTSIRLGQIGSTYAAPMGIAIGDVRFGDVEKNSLFSEIGSTSDGYYKKTEDGILNCWGRFSASAAGEVAVVFPHEFITSSDISITLQPISGAAFGISAKPSAISTTGFSAAAWRTDTNIRVASSVHWTCVGRWRNV